MKRISMALGVLGLAACGGSSTTPTSAQMAAYQRAALTASDTVTTYSTAAATATTPTDCATAAQQYQAQMQAAIQEMQANAPAMDDGMMSMGQGTAADMQCGVAVMAQTLAQYRAVACSSSDATQDQTMAAQHAAAMAVYAEHMQMRAAELSQMSSRMSGDGGTMMGGSGGTTMSGMWQGPSGQTMPWDHQIPGCAATPSAPAPTPTTTTTPMTTTPSTMMPSTSPTTGTAS